MVAAFCGGVIVGVVLLFFIMTASGHDDGGW
jgi:hypothetical protein